MSATAGVCMCASSRGGGCDGLFSYCIISWGGCVYQGRLNIVDIMCPPVVYEPFRTHAPPPHTHMCNRKFTWQYTVQSKESAHELSHTLKPNLLFSVKKWCFFALLPHSCVWTCPSQLQGLKWTQGIGLRRIRWAGACCWHSFNIIYWLLKKSIIPVLCFSLIITNISRAEH